MASPLHSSNNPASLTLRLGATIDVEQHHVRFLGDLILNLWDCGGQDAFMVSTQRSTIFQHVGVLIYIFEVSAHDAAKDAVYYRGSPFARCTVRMRGGYQSLYPLFRTRRQKYAEMERRGQGARIK